MFEEIYRNYKICVLKNNPRITVAVRQLSLRDQLLLVSLIISLIVNIIANFLNNLQWSVISIISMLALCGIIIAITLKNAKKDNTKYAINYKNDKLLKWIQFLENSEIGPLNSVEGMDTLINCVDNRIELEKLKIENRPGVLVNGIATAIIIPCVLRFIEYVQAMGEGNLDMLIALLLTVLCAFIEVLVIIVVLYSYYIEYVCRDYRLLCYMKNDCIYMKQLYSMNRNQNLQKNIEKQ